MSAPVGRSASFAPSLATSASLGSPRGGTAASAMPGTAAVGRSLREWTARSTSPASRQLRSALTKTPVPPICVNWAWLTSPNEVSPTSSTGTPARSLIRPATVSDWVMAIGLLRVPRRRTDLLMPNRPA